MQFAHSAPPLDCIAAVLAAHTTASRIHRFNNHDRCSRVGNANSTVALGNQERLVSGLFIMPHVNHKRARCVL